MNDVVHIPLTKGMSAIIDAADAPLVAGYRWLAHGTRGRWYAMAAVPNSKPRIWVHMHRLILGIGDESLKTDHRDGNGLNNTRGNLRPATYQQNNRNARKLRRGSSRYKGVCLRKCGWEARITVSGQLIHLGIHRTEEAAARAYDEAARIHFGEFANTNFSGERL